jgi:hypothetical protein
MSIEVMRQALEALEMLARYENPETRVQVRKPKDGGPIVTMYPHKVASDAAAALRAAIEQAEKPVAWYDSESGITDFHSFKPVRKPSSPTAEWIPLYTAPRQWVELTDDEARALVNRATFGDRTNWQALVYMVDAKLKEKNHG